MKRFISVLVAVLAVSVSSAAFAQRQATPVDDGAPSAEEASQILAETRPLAEQGDAGAQYNMGVLYDQGYGVEKNFSTAREWYIKAANQHFAKAEHNLGIIYESGKGVKSDPARAATWFERAAKDGEPAAQNNLAVMYVRGDGVPRDMIQAAIWAARAATGGNQSAQQNLPQIVSGLPRSHVVGDNVNIRSGPAKNTRVVRQADSSTEVVLLATKDDWTQVLFPDNYVIGWVASFLLSDSNAPVARSAAPASAVKSAQGQAKADTQADTEQASASATDTADDPGASSKRTVTASAVNIRSRPDRSSPVKFQAHSGDVLTVLRRQKSWRYVKADSGRTGWVAGFLLVPVSD